MLHVYLIINCMYKTCLLLSVLALAVIFFSTARTVSAAWGIDSSPPTVSFLSLRSCYDQTSDPVTGWTSNQPFKAEVKDSGSGASGVDPTKVSFRIKNISITPNQLNPPDPDPAIAKFPGALVSGDKFNGSYEHTFSATDLNDTGGVNNRYMIGVKAKDYRGNETINPTYKYSPDFSYQAVCPSEQWIQTTVGDVHSNGKIDTPGGPPW